MRDADRKGAIGTNVFRLHDWPRRYGLALAAVIATGLLRYSLGGALATTARFVLFYPTIMTIAVLGGFGPGVFATLLAAAIADYFFMEPLNSFAVANRPDILSLGLFVATGIAISWLGGLFRRRTKRLQEFEKAVEGLEEMITVVDRNYHYVVANRAFLSYRGVSREQLLGHSLAELMGADVFETTLKPKLDECFGGKVVKFEKRYKYPTLGERDFSVSYFPIEGATGVERVACILQDITQRKEAERSLRLFRTLIDESNDAVEVVDPETLRFLDVNEKACKDLGYSREELLGMTVFDINPELDESARTRVLERLQKSGFVVREGVHRRKDGSLFPVETSLRHVDLDQTYVVAISRDISQRKRAEEALRSSETHFRLLVEQASDGIFIADAQGKYLDVNSAGAGMLGYTREELLQLSIPDIVMAEETPRVALEVARFEGGTTVLSEWKFRRKDGSFFSGEVCGKQLPDGRLQGILRDTTERRHAEEEMRRNEERFRVALKDSPITVFSQDRELRYAWIYNPQLSWEQDAIGKTDSELIGEKKAARLVELKRRALETGEALREEVVIPSEGKSMAFDVAVEPLRDANGNVIGITGAFVDIARLREMTDRLQDARDRLQQEKSYLESEIQAELGFEEIVGQSAALREVLKNVRVVAPTDSTVLLLGETGTGKELVARSLHGLSSRRNKTFIKLNCAAVPLGLLESELFGHEKGAFTGAVSRKVGRIELADGGTLFLDEVGELPLELQPKLLRVLQDREFERLGGVQTRRVDVRIISASNRNLRQDIADRMFREDLFYRLNVFPIEMPPLRERRADIPILVHHFVRKYGARMGKHIETVPEETMTVFQNWNWPGNIRELENMIERMVILSKGRVLAAPPVELDVARQTTDDNLTDMEREHIVRILRETGGVLSGVEGAASRLGMKRTTLQSMIKRFGIEVRDFRRGSGAFGAS
jgi:formate hydrogenlyase transcriptional activator